VGKVVDPPWMVTLIFGIGGASASVKMLNGSRSFQDSSMPRSIFDEQEAGPALGNSFLLLLLMRMTDVPAGGRD